MLLMHNSISCYPKLQLLQVLHSPAHSSKSTVNLCQHRDNFIHFGAEFWLGKLSQIEVQETEKQIQATDSWNLLWLASWFINKEDLIS